jgi:hypothetical protein
MPLKKGHSPEVVSHNIHEMVRAGHAPKQAVAAALSKARKYKKMAEGGTAGGGTLNPDGSEQDPNKYGGGPTLAEKAAAKANQSQKLGNKIGYGMNQGGVVDEEEEDGPDVPSGMPKMMAYGADPETSSEDEDTRNPLSKPVVASGLNKNESMREMGRLGPDDIKRDLNEIRKDGEYYPDRVANPEEYRQVQDFAAALRREADDAPRPENFAMGGLVQGETAASDEPIGNAPEEGDEERGDTQMASTMREGGMMPEKPDGLEHRIMGDPTGPGLSQEALIAIQNKKKNRRYGVYDPSRG